MGERSQTPSSGASKPYHHGDLRHTLIEAGLALLAEEGVAALDLRKVARRTGVSHAAPYRHFADKQALLAAIAEEGFLQLAHALRTALQKTPDNSYQQLQGVALAYVQFACNHPALMREMFSGLTINRTTYPELYAASKTAFVPIVEVVQRGQERGEITPGDPVHLTVTVWSLIHGLAVLFLENQIPEMAANPDMITHTTLAAFQTLYSGLQPAHRSDKMV